MSRDPSEELFDILGKKCVKCGFCDIRALQFDHKYGGGNENIRVMKSRYTLYSPLSIEKRIYAQELQLLEMRLHN